MRVHWQMTQQGLENGQTMPIGMESQAQWGPGAIAELRLLARFYTHRLELSLGDTCKLQAATVQMETDSRLQVTAQRGLHARSLPSFAVASLPQHSASFFMETVDLFDDRAALVWKET